MKKIVKYIPFFAAVAALSLFTACPAIDVAIVGDSDLSTRYRKNLEQPAMWDDSQKTAQSRSLEQPPSDTDKPSVMIMPVNIHGNSSLSSQFTDSIALELIRSDKFEVVDRERLRLVLREQGFSQSGLVDPERASEIGRIVGAQYIFAGEAHSQIYTDEEGNRYNDLIERCTIRIIDVETSSIYAVIRKSPGTAWDWGYRLMYIVPLTLIWDSEDIHVKSTRYDSVAEQLVVRFIRVLEHGSAGL